MKSVKHKIFNQFRKFIINFNIIFDKTHTSIQLKPLCSANARETPDSNYYILRFLFEILQSFGHISFFMTFEGFKILRQLRIYFTNNNNNKKSINIVSKCTLHPPTYLNYRKTSYFCHYETQTQTK